MIYLGRKMPPRLDSGITHTSVFDARPRLKLEPVWSTSQLKALAERGGEVAGDILPLLRSRAAYEAAPDESTAATSSVDGPATSAPDDDLFNFPPDITLPSVSPMLKLLAPKVYIAYIFELLSHVDLAKNLSTCRPMYLPTSLTPPLFLYLLYNNSFCFSVSPCHLGYSTDCNRGYSTAYTRAAPVTLPTCCKF